MIDNFARLLVDWLRVALHGMPESLREVKFDRRFHNRSLISITGHSSRPSSSWKPLIDIVALVASNIHNASRLVGRLVVIIVRST